MSVVIDDFAKAHLHDKLRGAREALVWKLEGLSEHDVRRPMTPTGTNLLGLVKHNALSDALFRRGLRPYAAGRPPAVGHRRMVGRHPLRDRA